MTEPFIIAIETSGRSGSVALARGGDLLGQCPFSTQTEHARELLPALQKIQEDTGVVASAVRQCYLSIGPGSFTGLRVAVTFARHLALACGAKIVAVPTLSVIARACADLADPPSPLAVILDAKRGQVFGTVFRFSGGAYAEEQPPRVTRPAELLSHPSGSVSVMGEGVEYHPDAVAAVGARVVDRALWTPTAANVHQLGWPMAQAGQFTAARDLVPLYLRRPEAEEVWERRERERTDRGA
ncbi:MAG: tRNA (adenosine(37)-N6)-threonylcarbamoyltransferase complex dimerization subunit type 1 TsaB [Planctomycetota bacterium]|nr:MAG: tRNA (adenosine(37)-N6)-threonylcarbamoyltransferase complex dimerization subunit type 1 TsaB [Planctomycetota bacterium]